MAEIEDLDEVSAMLHDHVLGLGYTVCNSGGRCVTYRQPGNDHAFVSVAYEDGKCQVGLGLIQFLVDYAEPGIFDRLVHRLKLWDGVVSLRWAMHRHDGYPVCEIDIEGASLELMYALETWRRQWGRDMELRFNYSHDPARAITA